MHELFRGIPAEIFALMIAIPLAMAAAAVVLGWKARTAALARRAAGKPRQLAEDALGAGMTVAIVPLAFVAMVLWARFGG